MYGLTVKYEIYDEAENKFVKVVDKPDYPLLLDEAYSGIEDINNKGHNILKIELKSI